MPCRNSQVAWALPMLAKPTGFSAKIVEKDGETYIRFKWDRRDRSEKVTAWRMLFKQQSDGQWGLLKKISAFPSTSYDYNISPEMFGKTHKFKLVGRRQIKNVQGEPAILTISIPEKK